MQVNLLQRVSRLDKTTSQQSDDSVDEDKDWVKTCASLVAHTGWTKKELLEMDIPFVLNTIAALDEMAKEQNSGLTKPLNPRKTNKPPTLKNR